MLQSIITLGLILLHTMAVDIIGFLLLLFVFPWNRRLYRQLIGRFMLPRWLEANVKMLPKTNYVIHGDPLDLHLLGGEGAGGRDDLSRLRDLEILKERLSSQQPQEGPPFKKELFKGGPEEGVFQEGSQLLKESSSAMFPQAGEGISSAPPAGYDEDLRSSSSFPSSSPSSPSSSSSSSSSDAPCMSILISNHQVDLDWLYLMEAARLFSAHSSIKVVLKETLKFIPILGQAMWLLDFLFLKRQWESDRTQLYRLLGGFVKERLPVMLILFPEGTTVNTRAMEKSHSYARQHSRPHLDLLLLPRSTGFEACLKAMEKGHPIVYDVTLAFRGFSGEIPTYQMGYERAVDVEIPNAGKMLKGQGAQVHLDIRAIPATEITRVGVERWLDERWVRKERLLRYFATHQRFPLEECGKGRSWKGDASSQALWELWTLLGLSFIILPFALVMFIPYSLIVTLTYSYIKWNEYSRGMLSREEKQIHRETVFTNVMKYIALIFLVGTILAWLFTAYSFLTNYLGINFPQFG